MKRFFKVGREIDAYVAKDGSVVQREWGNTSSGTALGGRWVYRNAVGEFIDYSQYRNDLEAGNGILLERNSEIKARQERNDKSI